MRKNHFSLLLIITAFLVSFPVKGDESLNFYDLMDKLKSHSFLKELDYKAKSLDQISRYSASWQNPKLKVDALNLPINDPTLGNHPMSGIAFTLSQTFPLGGKLSKTKRSLKERARYVENEKEGSLRSMQRSVWLNLIAVDRSGAEQGILNENIAWLDQMIKVTSKRYSTGKASQEALLDLKVRRSEIEGRVKRKTVEIERIWQSVALLVDEPNKQIQFDHSSIPWG